MLKFELLNNTYETYLQSLFHIRYLSSVTFVMLRQWSSSLSAYLHKQRARTERKKCTWFVNYLFRFDISFIFNKSDHNLSTATFTAHRSLCYIFRHLKCYFSYIYLLLFLFIFYLYIIFDVLAHFLNIVSHLIVSVSFFMLTWHNLQFFNVQ